MTDKELLEAAAEAAGIPVPKLERGRPNPWHYIDDKGIHKDISCGGDGTSWKRWNPLEDDGDALRLAVRMEMDLFVRAGRWTEAVRPMGPACKEPHGDDPYAATRRAIVRAAAESAKVMP